MMSRFPRLLLIASIMTANAFTIPSFSTASRTTRLYAATKAKKDPNAPKRAKSAYNCFMSKNRATIKEQHPDASFGDLAGLVSQSFKALTPAQRQPYDAMADEDKLRYKQEMATYVPPADLGAVEESAGKKKTKKKDPNAPKKALSAYFLYSAYIRPQIKADNPGIAFGDVAKEISVKFKSLSAEDEALWQEKAAQDKVRYANEMEAYKNKAAP